jgi:hypothetical protein
MTYESDLEILNKVFAKVKAQPSFMKEIINTMVSAVTENAQELRERAADMEIVASIAFGLVTDRTRILSSVKKQFEDLALSKITKHYENNALPWEELMRQKLAEQK